MNYWTVKGQFHIRLSLTGSVQVVACQWFCLCCCCLAWLVFSVDWLRWHCLLSCQYGRDATVAHTARYIASDNYDTKLEYFSTLYYQTENCEMADASVPRRYYLRSTRQATVTAAASPNATSDADTLPKGTKAVTDDVSENNVEAVLLIWILCCSRDVDRCWNSCYSATYLLSIIMRAFS